MFQRFHAMKEQREGGFTLIELLVVILIIAILAAIAIPVFLNQRKKGWVSAQQSSLKDAATAMETAATEYNGAYTGTGGSDDVSSGCGAATCLDGFGFNPSTNVTVTVTAATGSDFCLTAVHSLLGSDAWGTATYDSDEGEPTNPDSC